MLWGVQPVCHLACTTHCKSFYINCLMTFTLSFIQYQLCFQSKAFHISKYILYKYHFLSKSLLIFLYDFYLNICYTSSYWQLDPNHFDQSLQSNGGHYVLEHFLLWTTGYPDDLLPGQNWRVVGGGLPCWLPVCWFQE